MSHSIKIKTLKGANFLRFGNEEFVFDFSKGVIGLMGENGLGKSSILDAVCICLFNETYRQSTQSEWTNNINEKGLYLSLSLDRISSTVDNYVIVRRPTSKKVSERLMIYKNDVLLSDIPDYQEYIENTILGFGVNIFKNTIAVSGSTPFISMTPEQKRKFSENLFSIKQVREYKKRVNGKLSEDLLTKRILAQEISSISNKILEYNNVVNLAKVNITAEVTALDNEISSLNSSIDDIRRENEIDLDAVNKLQLKLDNITNDAIELNNKKKSLEFKDRELNNSITRKSMELDQCRKEYKQCVDEANRIAPNVVCTKCGNSFTEEQADKHRELHLEHSKEIASRGKILKNELDELKSLVTNELDEISNLVDSAQRNINQVNSDIVRIRHKISYQNSNISSIENNIKAKIDKKKSLLEKPEQVNVIEFAKRSIEECNNALELHSNDLRKIERKIKAYEYIIEMCSDDGIKKMLLREFVPMLNRLISSYLERFDLPVKIEFDEYFNHTLESPKGLGQKHNMMSKGQKTRINLAILFAMVDLVKMIGNVKCNLLILDEFADEGLDSKGFSAAVESIRKVADSENKSIVIITHKQEDVLYDNLDALYELELKNQFSVLKKVKDF